MEHYEKIAKAVESTYANQPELQLEVLGVMKKFRKLAEPSHRVCTIIKSQKKVDGDVLNKLKTAVCDFSVAFREVFPDRMPCPKLHWLECIIVPFAENLR